MAMVLTRPEPVEGNPSGQDGDGWCSNPSRKGRVLMPLNRIFPSAPITSLREYVNGGGGTGLAEARALEPGALIDMIEASGLRARGGAGQACGPKWRTVRGYADGAAVPPSVVVNAAEGEPGSFKDRAILYRNPYLVLEGALVAAHAVGARDVIVALKRIHTKNRRRVADAIDEAQAAGWLDGVDVAVFEGPSEYLYGEETAMLEAIDGRPPFPRIAPPYRHGVHEIFDRRKGAGSAGGSVARVQLASAAVESGVEQDARAQVGADLGGRPAGDRKSVV